MYLSIYYCTTRNIKLPVVFMNIGGISTITWFHYRDYYGGRDIGPGNYLIDKWIRENPNLNYDEEGKIAKTG